MSKTATLSTPSIRIGGSFRSDLESMLVKCMRKDVKTGGRNYMYGSSAAFCPRQNFFLHQQHNDVRTQDEFSRIYMGIGNGIEDAIVASLRENARLVAHNIRIPRIEPYVSGKIDIIFFDHEDHLAIGEIKSCGKLPNEPKESYMRQAQTYSLVTGIDPTYLIFQSRNVRAGFNGPLLMRTFTIDTTIDTLAMIAQKIAYTAVSIEHGYVPRVPPVFQENKQCGWCSFKPYCWKDAKHDFIEQDSITMKTMMNLAKPLAEKIMAERPQRRDEFVRSIYDPISLDEPVADEVLIEVE